MAFGKRQGWKEGAVVIPGRKPVACRVLSQTSVSIVFEAPTLPEVPYQFELLVEGTLWSCELKTQRGHQITVGAEPVKRQPARPVALDSQTFMEQATQWAGCRPTRGFKC